MMLFVGVTKIYLTLIKAQQLTDAKSDLQHRTHMVFLMLQQNLQQSRQSTCLDKNTKTNANPILLTTTSFISKKSNTDILQIQRCFTLSNKTQLRKITFFIRNTHRKTQDKRPIFSLYRKIEGQASEELIAGVSNMDICYITKQNDKTLKCFRKNTITKLQNILGVHLRLLLMPLTQLQKTTQQTNQPLFITVALK
jgi:vacuolar-type H+-ATPase subunit F/Vma7